MAATLPAPSPVSLRERRQLMRRVHELGPTEHAEIYRILCEGDVDHMQNNNGVFVNLSNVRDDVVRRIQSFVDFCHDNKHDLDEYDKRLSECKMSQNYMKAAAMLGKGGSAPSCGAPGASSPCGVQGGELAAANQPVRHAPPPGVSVLPPASSMGLLGAAPAGPASCKFTVAKKKYAKRLATAAAASSCAPEGSWGTELVAEAYD